MKCITRAALAASISAMLATGSAMAADVELKLSHFLPSVHGLQTEILEPWAKALDEKTATSVEVEIFSAGSSFGNIARQLDQVQAGVIDIAVGLAPTHIYLGHGALLRYEPTSGQFSESTRTESPSHQPWAPTTTTRPSATIFCMTLVTVSACRISPGFATKANGRRKPTAASRTAENAILNGSSSAMAAAASAATAIGGVRADRIAK